MVKMQKKQWNHQEKQMRIDVNKYIAKYDFDIARKICPIVSGNSFREDLQNAFKATALMEVLQQCSNYLSRGKKQVQSLYTFDGVYISDLDSIPEGTKILLVSEKSGPKDQESRLVVSKDYDFLSRQGSQAFSIAESQPEMI